MQRIEELPPELSAELFYKCLTEINKKTQEPKTQQLNLESQKIKTNLRGFSENSIKARVEYAIKHLTAAPKEKHRKILKMSCSSQRFILLKLNLEFMGVTLSRVRLLSKNGGGCEIRTRVTLLA